MLYTQYEAHIPYNSEFPLRFHLDTVTKDIYEVSSHWHESIEILLVEQGVIEIISGDIKYLLKPASVILFSPNQPHLIRSVKGTGYYYVLTVDEDFCVNFGIDTGQISFAAVSESDSIVDCYKQIAELMKTQPFAYKEEVKTLVLRMIILLYRKHNLEMAENNVLIKDKTIKKAVEYLNTNYTDPITIDELSKYVGLSKHYLCKKFKRQTNNTIIEYLNTVRCRNAKRLIKSGQYTVTEAAQISGFSNMSYFSKTYKKIIHELPSAKD